MLMRRRLGNALVALLVAECLLLLHGCGGEGPPPPNLWVYVNDGNGNYCGVGTWAPELMTLNETQTYGCVFTLSNLWQGTLKAVWWLSDQRKASEAPGDGDGDFDLQWAEGGTPPPPPPGPCSKWWVAEYEGYLGAPNGTLTESTSGEFTPAQSPDCTGCGNNVPLNAYVSATFTPGISEQSLGPNWDSQLIYVTSS